MAIASRLVVNGVQINGVEHVPVRSSVGAVGVSDEGGCGSARSALSGESGLPDRHAADGVEVSHSLRDLCESYGFAVSLMQADDGLRLEIRPALPRRRADMPTVVLETAADTPVAVLRAPLGFADLLYQLGVANGAEIARREMQDALGISRR